MPIDDIRVIGLGARASIGLRLAAVSAAVRAGLTRFREHEFLVDRQGAPIIVAQDAKLGVGDAVEDRISTMTSSAIEEALAPVLRAGTTILRGRRIHVLLGLPAPRPGALNLADHVLDEITKPWRGRVSLGTVAALPDGHGACMIAMKRALELLRINADDLVLVAAGDSYMHADALEWLEEHDQLYTASNPRGFIPGEGAGAFLLSQARTTSELGLRSWSAVRAIASAHEENRVKTDTVCLGYGLTQAIELTLAALPQGDRVHRTICDLNGEPYRADEYGYARVRTAQAFWNAADFITPADCWGDVGAASGALFVGLACAAARKTSSYGRWALLWTSSESGLRTATLLDLSQMEDEYR
jgi:3-oxoacyl-[acyl-carrier-protein] synthase-1